MKPVAAPVTGPIHSPRSAEPRLAPTPAGATRSLLLRWRAALILAASAGLAAPFAAGAADADAASFASLHAFVPATEGYQAMAGLVQARDGAFYGVNNGGGAFAYGTVYRMTADGTVTLLHSFTPAEGGGPQGTLIQASDGNLYGTAVADGPGGGGTVFRISTTGDFAVLHAFVPATDGKWPRSGLFEGSDGRLYGTTHDAGPQGSFSGTLYAVSLAGEFEVLHAFSTAATDGSQPQSGVVQAPDGNYYGTTTAGGAFGLGTVYRWTPAGAFSIVHSFDGPGGSQPYGGLIYRRGHLVGTTSAGGSANLGTIFSIGPLGRHRVLHAFQQDDVGTTPLGTLVAREPDGLIGTVPYGGPLHGGAVFRLDDQGKVSLVHAFLNATSTPEGMTPEAGLVVGRDGRLYGTTLQGGVDWNVGGTVYSVGP